MSTSSGSAWSVAVPGEAVGAGEAGFEDTSSVPKRNVYRLVQALKQRRHAEHVPGARPPRPVILFNLSVPPALILASRRSLRKRACSAARWAAASSGEASVMALVCHLAVGLSTRKVD